MFAITLLYLVISSAYSVWIVSSHSTATKEGKQRMSGAGRSLVFLVIKGDNLLSGHELKLSRVTNKHDWCLAGLHSWGLLLPFKVKLFELMDRWYFSVLRDPNPELLQLLSRWKNSSQKSVRFQPWIGTQCQNVTETRFEIKRGCNHLQVKALKPNYNSVVGKRRYENLSGYTHNIEIRVSLERKRDLGLIYGIL